MTNVYVLLDSRDIALLEHDICPNDFVISDLACNGLPGTKVSLSINKEDELVDYVHEIYSSKLICDDKDNGYVNNFYECTIRPLIKYIDSIDNLLTSKANLSFRFGIKPKYMIKTSTYFLAEYESMGVKLYDRHSTFLPYIIEYLDTRDAKYSFESISLKSQALVLNPIRKVSVFIYRYYHSLYASMNKKKVNKVDSVVYSNCIVLRTIGQARTILGLLEHTKTKTLVILPKSSLGEDTFSFMKSMIGNHYVDIVNCGYPTALFASKIYLSPVFRKPVSKTISLRGIKLNLSNALSEIRLMKKELSIYQYQIESEIRKYTFSSSPTLFSLEFTSPHSYIDSLIARNYGFNSVQVQPCDRAIRPLPKPISSNFFLAKNRAAEKSFKQCWPEYAKTIMYLGSLGFNNSDAGNRHVKSNNKCKKKVCLFSSANSKLNAEIMDFIQTSNLNNRIEFYVKSHPRDTTNYDSYSIITDCLSNNIALYNMISELDLAITFPSAVITEIIQCRVPICIYIPQHSDYIAANEQLEKALIKFRRCYSLKELQELILDIDEFRTEAINVIDSYIESSSLSFDIPRFERKLKNILEEQLS